MKHYFLPGKKLSFLMIFILPLLLGSSRQSNEAENRFSLINYSVFTPGSDVRINLYSADKSNNYHVRLYKINNIADFFVNINRNYSSYNFDVWGNEGDFLLKYTTPVKEWNAVVQHADYYANNKNLDLGVIKEPGYYVVQASKGNQVGYCAVVVSGIAMVYKTNGKHLLAFAANSVSGEIINKSDFSLYRNNKKLAETTSNTEGLAKFELNDSLKNTGERFLLIAKAADETVLSDPYFYFRGSDNYLTAYIYTNQPVYRPGQKVYFKAIMRKKSGDDFINLPGENFSVSIRSPKNQEVYSGSLKTNEFGSLSGQFELDNEADLGYYSIILTKDNISYYGSFEVQEYKKPEYLVNVKTDRKQYSSGDTVKINVSADYYFGSPVLNAKVNVKIFRQHYWRPWWYWTDYAWFYKSFAPKRIPGYGQKELLSQQSGQLDKEGNFNYEISAPQKQDNDYIYIISADVTDNSRNTISGETEVYITRGSFSITTSPERYFIRKGEPVNLRINTADFSSKPVSTSFKVVVDYPSYRDNGRSYSKPPADTLTGRTDSLGKATLAYMPAILLNGNFKYTVYASDNKGRIISAAGSFYVGDISYYYYGISNNDLEIVTDKDTYNKGDSLTAYIFFPQTGMDVLVSYESNDFIGNKIYRNVGNNLTLKLKLTGEYTPSFNIDVTYLKDNQMHHTSKMIGVLDKDKFLTVTAEPSKQIYKPGEKVDYKFKVTDYKGRPVKNVDLSVGVIDESIYAIKEDQTPDIKTFYYSPSYTDIPTYSSLQNNNNYNGVSRHATVLDRIIKYDNLSPEGTGNLFGKITSKNEHVRFENTYVMLSGEKYFYRIEADTSGKYQFSHIKQGRYDIFLLFNNASAVYMTSVNVDDQTFKNIDMSSYSGYYYLAGGRPVMLRSNIAVQAGVVREKDSMSETNLSETQSVEAKKFVQPEIRSKFYDAAFWNADVITDVNGDAAVSFILPDNLTTWRTTIRGITAETLVGQNTNKVIARKNLLVRLEPPRFFRENDELVLSTIVHNYLHSPKEVKISLNPGDLKITGSRINQTGYDTAWSNSNKKFYTVNIDNDSEVRIDWQVKVTKPIGESVIEASALTDEESDAVKLKIPIHPMGIKIEKPVVADYSTDRGNESLSFDIPENIDLRTAKFSFNISPSLAGTMLKAVDDLVGYPYGCVEQTMSRFLPTIVVANTFRKLNAPVDADVLKELPKMVDAGLKRLYNFQHSDGGWGWWTNDNTNPYMTAYVIYGLTLAGKAGYPVDSTVYYKGISNLEQQLKNSGQENFTTRAYMIYVLSNSAGSNLNKKGYLSDIESLLKENLNSYALSLMALSLNNMGFKIRTSAVLTKLSESAVKEGSYVYWGGKAWHYSWHNDKVQSTAFAVKALLLGTNNYQRATKAVRWLLLQKQGFSWRSTQETATVLYALTDFLEKTNELNPNFSVSVYLNNVKIMDKNYTKSDVFNDQPSITISGLTQKILRSGDNKLEIIKNGPGTAYVSGVNRYYSNQMDSDNSTAFSVRRNYYLLKAENQGDKIVYVKHKIDGEIKSGDLLLVKTHVEASDKGLQYFILEDMLPSGFEAVKDQSQFEIEDENNYQGNYRGMRPWIWFYADREYRDDRVSFFVTNVSPDMDFTYIIRAEIPGDFNVSPAQAYLMYYPEVSGNSTPFRIKVGDQ